MTPRQFLEVVVHPTVADARAEPSAVHKALCAVAVLDMLAAHLHETRKDKAALVLKTGKAIRDDTGYREFLAERSDGFRLLRDIAKAQKHMRLERGQGRLVSHAAQVGPRSLGYGVGRFGEGPFGGTEQIVVEADDGSVRNVLALVGEVLSFLEGEMHQPSEEV